MKFICFCYYDPQKVAQLSPQELEAIPNACKPYDEALNASGKKRLLVCFTDPETWKSIRPSTEKPLVTEGSFQSTQEQVGVFFVVEAENIEEAVETASLHPSAHLGHYFGGGMEVRPCELFEEYV